MDKGFNWKKYLIFAGIVIAITLVFRWKISIGYFIGTLAYFINDKLLSKRFPSLDSNGKAIGSMIGFMFLQGVVIFAAAVSCWFVGRFESFFAAFAALTIPTFYFIIVGIFKK